jgi:hypothetical protein
MSSRLAPSPAMVVALIALFISLGGVSYAAVRIGTGNIKNGAVTAKKLHKSAVTRSKIRSHAVTHAKLGTSAVTAGNLAKRSVNATKVDSTIATAYTGGLPVAGVNVAANGTVRRFFDRIVGSKPGVRHPQTGVYEIVFPGLQGRVLSKSTIALATLVSSMGEIRVTTSGGNAKVWTASSDGKPKDRAFQYVLVLRSP